MASKIGILRPEIIVGKMIADSKSWEVIQSFLVAQILKR